MLSDRPREDVPPLPPDFVLGVGSSAFQSEGAASEDGRGPSIWDTFLARAGERTAATDGTQPPAGVVTEAVDHYHRVDEDVELLRRLGVGGYRFSVSWPRVQPDGRGTVNPSGLDFYDRLVDRLLEAGVAPTVTLYHWDLPQALEDDGGWLNPATVDHFATYAAVVGERLADRVAHWLPVHAPTAHATYGYVTGVHAPGWKLMFDGLPVVHQLLVAHGRATVELRAAGASSVGCSNHHAPMWPASEDPADVGATKLFDAWWNGLALESMLLGRYPDDLMPLLEESVGPGDLATIRQPLDFYGVDYFGPMRVSAAAEDAELPFALLGPVGHPTTEAGWAVVPDALREWLITLRARLRAALPPVVVTGCGAAYADSPGPSDDAGVVDDADRIAYLAGHLHAVGEAAQRGVDVRGFYAWSLLDQHTWDGGRDHQYGLVHVDPTTRTRTPKRSFEWYARLIDRQPRSVG